MTISRESAFVDDFFSDLSRGSNPQPLVEWMQSEFYIPELNGPIVLYPYQIAALLEATRVGPDGLFVYDLVLWSDIKKSAKCLALTTPVLMSGGDWKAAYGVEPGDYIVGWSDNEFTHSVVHNVEIQPKEPMYRITTSRGRQLVVTAEHPVLVCGDGRPPSFKGRASLNRQEWKPAKYLDIGDRVEVALGYAHEQFDIDYKGFYLLGAYIGDGGQCRITTAHDEIRLAFAERFELTKMAKYTYFLRGSQDWLREHDLLHGSSAELSNYSNAYTKRVPVSVFMGGKHAICAFLSGYMDTDGFVSNSDRKQPSAGWGSVNKELLEDCQKLLAAIGINATLFQHDSKLKGKRFEAWKLMVYGKDQIRRLSKLLSPKVPHKKEHLEYWANWSGSGARANIYTADKVVGIELLPPQNSIAIEVEGTHTHITNGVITHNSTIAGAVTLWRCINTRRGKFRIVANDLKQAASRVFDSIVLCLELNRKLGAQFEVMRYSIKHLPTNSVIEAVPVDPKGEAGGADDMVEYTELHAADNDAAKKMWTETTISPLKFGKSQRWVDTYAGHSGESPILEPLYFQLVQERNLISAEYPFYAKGRTFAMWNTTPRLPWQTPAYYQSEAQVLLPLEYRRVHNNEWTSSISSFVEIAWWDACKQSSLPDIGKYKELVIALDAAVSGDCFAMVALSRTADKTYLRYARAWQPVGGKIQYSGADKTDRDYPEGELRWLCSEFNVIMVAYDPYQLHSFCTALAIEGIAAFEEFNQEKPRLVADKALYDSIRDRRIVHDGSYPDVRDHLLNANSTAEDKDKLRIVKREQTKKIDLAVALSMCDERARRYLPE